MTADTVPPSNALFTGMDDLMVRASDTLMENNIYAGSEQYQGINVLPDHESIRQKISAPTANANIPIIPVKIERPMILAQIIQFLFRMSSLYLNTSEIKNPNNSPIIRNDDVFITQSWMSDACVSVLLNTKPTINSDIPLKPPLPHTS